jgi:mRNA-degrading endonuclease RelE of RelBE toxin-antitoxin system
MNWKINMDITVTNKFKKNLKILAKKYKNIKKDLQHFSNELIEQKIIGDKISNTGGKNIYKARISNSSSNKGKSGGYRVIYYIKNGNNYILLTIYTKSEKENLHSKEINKIIVDERL